MESITTVLQKVHLKTDFISTTIPSSMKVTNFTELSKYFWEMKRKGIKKPIMHWSVIDHAKQYQNGSKRCNLCLTEQCHILTSLVDLINKRFELVLKCCHENKFQLVNYKAISPAN